MFILSVVGATEQETLPDQVDLSPQFDQLEIPQRSQEKRPTCSVFTVVGALEFTQAKHGKKTGYLSVEYANWAKNQVMSTSTDGGFFLNIWRGIRRHGICVENDYLYKSEFDAKAEPDETARKNAAEFFDLPTNIRWIKQWNPKTGLEDSQFYEIKKALHEGWPVCVGLRWPHQVVRKDDVLLWVPEDDVFDGHSVLFVGYQDDAQVEGGGYFIIRNTNNPGQNEKMSYRYATSYANDAVFFPLLAETVRIPVSRDLWVSSADGETEGNNGKASQLKLKGYQEFSILDFDLSAIKGRNIEKATLHIKLSGNERLRRVGVSTLGAEWYEGTGTSYAKEPESSSFRWQKNPDTPWVAGLPYSDLTLVMFDVGGTFWSHAEASEPDDGWQTIEVDPKIVAARSAGLSYGFVLFDDTGTELRRESDNSDKALFHPFPNRFFYSREQNASVAPYLVVECSDAKPATPPQPQTLTAETKGLPPGEAVFRWEIPPLANNDVLGFFVTVNGKEWIRSTIPVAANMRQIIYGGILIFMMFRYSKGFEIADKKEPAPGKST